MDLKKLATTTCISLFTLFVKAQPSVAFASQMGWNNATVSTGMAQAGYQYIVRLNFGQAAVMQKMICFLSGTFSQWYKTLANYVHAGGEAWYLFQGRCTHLRRCNR